MACEFCHWETCSEQGYCSPQNNKIPQDSVTNGENNSGGVIGAGPEIDPPDGPHNKYEDKWDLDEIMLRLGNSDLTYGEAKAAINLLMVQERLEELTRTLKSIPALDKHSGASWSRGYISAQYTLRKNLKKRIAELQQQLKPNQGAP